MFEDYAMIPLDVPVPPVDTARLRTFVQTWCERCKFSDNVIRLLLYHARKPMVNGAPMPWEPAAYSDSLPPGTKFGWDPSFAASFPELTEWFESLPFAELGGLTFATQTDHVHEHMDIFGQNNSITYYEAYRHLEPRFYRTIFCYEDDRKCRENSFYVTTEYGGEKRFVRLPPETSVIAMSSSTCYHGAVHNKGHFKTTAVLYGDLDQAAHYDLLQRSLDRYGDLAVRLERPGPVMGPAAEFPYRGVEEH